MSEKLDDKTKELVGIAASVSGHCRPCFLYHFKQTKPLGVSLDEIQEVVQFAGRISAAGDQGMNEFILKTMKGEKEVNE
ncbi:MAG: carboxymuconolactone decarboxylase family protein [Candidatus Thermoplasmatota archaeon]|nr:carboxymuconolactone decarboxylase family protein [Candidatus Thermoplasmatota archaeon]